MSQAIYGLMATIVPAAYLARFGASIDQLELLIEQKTVTIAQLMRTKIKKILTVILEQKSLSPETSSDVRAYLGRKSWVATKLFMSRMVCSDDEGRSVGLCFISPLSLG